MNQVITENVIAIFEHGDSGGAVGDLQVGSIKFLVRGVPDEEDFQSIKQALSNAGYVCAQYGVPWLNHGSMQLKDAPAVVKKNWESTDVPVVHWDALNPRKEVLYIRTTTTLATAVRNAAASEGKSVNGWVQEVLARAVNGRSSRRVTIEEKE